MINRVGPIYIPTVSYCNETATKRVSKNRFASSISSMRESSSSIFKQLLIKIFFPITWLFKRTVSKLVVTTEELEIFEELIESAIAAGGEFFYSRLDGEKKLEKVVASCDVLYKRLSNKCFPNLEGILFLRQNLLKIRIRAFAALGNEYAVNKNKKELESIGGKVPEEVELQAKILLFITDRKYRFLIWGMNQFLSCSLKILLLRVSIKK